MTGCNAMQMRFSEYMDGRLNGREMQEIAAHLADLAHILSDWRSQTGELPDGNPWDWSYKDLACVIQARNAD